MSTDQLVRLLAAHYLVSSRYRRLIATAVRRWVFCSGFEWAKARVKQLELFLLKLRAGEEARKPEWWDSCYMEYAIRVARTGSFEKFTHLIQAWRTALTFYGRVKSVPSDEDVAKFENATATSSPPIAVLTRAGEILISNTDPRSKFPFREYFGFGVKSVLPEAILEGHPEHRNPLSLRLFTRKGRPTKVGRELLMDAWVVHTLGMIAGPQSRPRLLPFLPVLEGYEKDELTLGAVFCTIQPDGKARFFLSPPKWLQFLLEPWARMLYAALKRIPQDCTYHQERGALQVQEWLREGKTVWSFDLSSATDRFPLAFTRAVLEDLSLNRVLLDWVDLFCWLARVPAKPAYPTTSKVVVWRRGQPLGTLPSFAAFAISHHAVLRALWRRLGHPPRTAPYVVVGDDVVIADPALAAAYRDFMTQVLGCEISEPKSLAGTLGEFVGRIISAEGYAVKFKAPMLALRGDLIALRSALELIGPRALRAWRRTPLRDIVALLPGESYPGCNPGGFPKELVDKFLVEYFSREREVDPPTRWAVDPENVVQSRITGLYSFSVGYIPPPGTAEREPRGSAVIGIGGAPSKGPCDGSYAGWRTRPPKSPAWLRRVIDAAEASGILQYAKQRTPGWGQSAAGATGVMDPSESPHSRSDYSY
jgi:hypothetical protein